LAFQLSHFGFHFYTRSHQSRLILLSLSLCDQ
jgi:hypothetical protein